jgi:hypothetical protein
MESRTEMVTSPAAKRGRRLLTARHVDGRTRGGKRARKLAAELVGGFGTGITEVQRRACEQAGMLAALAEDLAARRLAGQAISFDELLRAEGVAKRAIQAIVAERPAKPAAARVLELRRQRWADQERVKKAQAKAKAKEAATNIESPDAQAAAE